MNNIKSISGEFFNALKIKKDEKIEYEKLFPEYFNLNSTKIKVLFVSPRMDEAGWYQQILPALYFSRKGKYLTSCITNISKSKQELESTTNIFIIPKLLIKSADIIVLPFVHQDLELQYKAIRAINPKTKIVYTVDYNFYDIPRNHNQHKTMDESTILSIEKNIYYSDKVFVPNMKMVEMLSEKLQNKFEIQKNIYVERIPYLLSPENYAAIDFIKDPEISKTDNKIRIGIISHWWNMEDINKNKSLFKWINKNYEDKVELVFFGTNPKGGADRESDKMKEFSDESNDFKYRRFSNQNYFYYYKNLYNLNLDCLFSLRNDTKFYEYGREAQEIIDASYYRIPVISNHTQTSLPEDFYFHGSKIKDIQQHVKSLVDNYDIARSFGENAKQYVLSNLALTHVKWDELENIYLTFNEPNQLNSAE